MTYFMSADTLHEKLANGEEIVIIDTRFDLQDKEAGKRAYLLGHLPKAIYLDLDKDLSGLHEEHGGNHPLPKMEDFAETIGNAGIDQHTMVVVYGESNDIFPARLWWMLHHAGHEDVYYLEGGYNAWVKQGYEVTTETPVLKGKTFISNLKRDEIVQMEYVKNRNAHTTLIDARAKDRYLGGHEPLHGVSGHIPGAKSYFWKDVLTSDGSWKDKADLKAYYRNLLTDDEVILSCGSGVSACVHMLGLKELGYDNIKIYLGSFSDWISYPENQIETKDES